MAKKKTAKKKTKKTPAKKRPRRSRPAAAGDATAPAPADLDPDITEQFILGLVTIRNHTTTPRRLAERHDLTDQQAAAYTAAARQHLAAVAGYDLVEQQGIRITRYNDIYECSRAAKDFKTAMACVEKIGRELGRPQGNPTGDATDARQAATDLAEVLAHLEPLDLAPQGSPAGELARLAVALIVSK